MRSRPEISVPVMVNSGAVRPTSQESVKQQAHAHEHGQEQADAARSLALGGWQLVHQDGNENDVVDAEHQLERGQREEGDPDLGIGENRNECFHGWPAY